MESPAGLKVRSKRSPDLPSQEVLPYHRAQVYPEPISLGPGSNLPFKGDQNINEPVSIDSVKNEQQTSKEKILRSLRNFPYEMI